MGRRLKNAAWFVGIVGGLVCIFGKPPAHLWVTVGVFMLTLFLAGAGVIVSGRFTLRGRTGPEVPVEGRGARVVGVGLWFLAAAAPLFAQMTVHRDRQLLCILGLVSGAGLACIGGGMGGFFVKEGWQSSAHRNIFLRVLQAVFLTYAYGWIGLVGLGFMIAAIVVLIRDAL